jgi:uncharacterized protein
MPLLVNVQELEHQDGRLSGELPVEDLDLEVHDDAIHPAETLTYDLNLQLMQDAILVRGEVVMPLECRCVRCLEPFVYRVEFPDWICHVPISGAEKAPVVKGFVDLTPYLREDILLAFPQHPLCRKDCPGLSTRDSKPPETGGHEESSSPWDKLNQLKL